MSPAPASRARDVATAIDDFEWPPTADELSVYEMGPDPWQKLQDASSQAFAARRREQLSQPRQQRAPERTPRSTRTRTRAVVIAACAIVAAAAGWMLYEATTRPVPVQVIHHPAPAATVTAAPPPITIVATYPVEPEPSSTAPLDSEPAASSTAPSTTDPIVQDADPASQVAPVDAPADAETIAAPVGTAAPAVGPSSR